MNSQRTNAHQPYPAAERSRGLMHHRSALSVFLLAIASFFTLAFGTALAAPMALINGDTVTGGAASQEAAAATAQGYVVTVVSNATWQTMTQAQFGTYDLLIIGDRTCSSVSASAATNSAVWAPVVMGTAGGRTLAGNRIVIGTDPVFHDGGNVNSLRGTIIRTGIRFAGKQPGRTGLYFCASCTSSSAPILAALGQLSTGTGTWTVNGAPPCGGAVSLIATEPAFVAPDLLTTASLQGWGCSVHESWPTFPSDWSALAVATDTPTKPTCGTDPNTGLNACGQAYILIAGSSIVVTSGSISISPLDATNPVGTSHTVTAHVSDAVSHAPLAGQTVTFTITGVNVGVAGVCTPADCKTDANGDVSFTYPDTNGAGDDTIKASFNDATGALQSATAQKHWVVTNHPPVAKCKNVTVSAAAVPNCKAFASVDDGSFDPDPADTITVTLSPAGPYPIGMTTVTLTVADNNGASDTCTAIVTVVDNSFPIVSGCPGNITVFTGPGSTTCSQTATWIEPLAASCTLVSFVGSHRPGDTFPGGPTTVTYTATDAAGHTNSCSFTVTVLDNTVPVLSGQGGPLTIECPAPPVFTAPTATENCDPNPAITFADATTAGTCPGAYSVTRTWTATDASGNVSATVSQTITVVDTTPPTLAGQGGNLTIECPAVPVFTAPTARDNCDPNPTIAFTDATTAGTCPGTYSVTRTWTATDCSGLVSVPVSQTITVVDTTPPVVACPSNVSVAFGAVPAAATTVAGFLAQGGTITDNCDPNPTVTSSDVAVGICPIVVTRTYTVTDCSGNKSTCTQTITVNNLFAGDGILWHQPLARNGASEDTDPGAGNTLKYSFKLGSTIPVQIHAQGCGGDVTANSNVTGKVVVFGDTNMDGIIEAGELPVTIGYNGVGGAGGVMDKIGPHLKYNLDTKKLPSTFKCFILQVTITDTATGESRVETVPLQAK
ncbi:MAG: HYR domain-containing protein [Chthoniobacteraceae bacterium]